MTTSEEHESDSVHEEPSPIHVATISSDCPSLATATNEIKNEQAPNTLRTPENPTEASKPFTSPLTKHDVGWRRTVRHFSPSWFSVTMGTGVVGVLLNTIPFQARWLYYLSIVFFILNTILFVLALSVSILRYVLYPEIWLAMIRDPVNSLFLGTFPMGFATLVELWILICVPSWGSWAKTFAWALWIVDTVVAVAITIFLSFIVVSRHNIDSLDRITAAQLLPIAATIVASAIGAEVAGVLDSPQDALGTVIACYVLWGIGVPLAMVVLVIYYQRLAVHKLPPREIIVSSFLPLGPLGFGGFAIMYLGKVSRDLFPLTNALDEPIAGSVMYVIGFFIALIMWGFGLVWFCLAIASIYQSRPFPFNMGWWGFTFPLGVFSASTLQLGKELSSQFFKVLGTIFACSVILLWMFVAVGTVNGAWTGKLFYAPCVVNLKSKATADDDDETTSKSA